LDSPTECWELQAPSFHNPILRLIYGFVAWKRWYEKSDRQAPLRAYALHRLQLQFLQTRGPVGHWVLKSPDHMFNLPTLFKTYPDTRVIHLHRAPRESVASACNLFAGMISLFLRAFEKKQLGPYLKDFLAESATKVVADRESLSNAHICDVAYTDLVANPIETVERIYQHFNMAMTPEFYDALGSWQNSQRLAPHRGSIHNLDGFGLTESEIDLAFADYRNRFRPYLSSDCRHKSSSGHLFR
jgi:hypothetical protein